MRIDQLKANTMNTQAFARWLRHCCIAGLAALALLSGCVANKPYRLGGFDRVPYGNQMPNIVSRGQLQTVRHYDLAFIEFDDMGEFWTIGQLGAHKEASSQLEDAVALIEKRKREKPVVVVAFIHGWKNNASRHDDSRDKSLGLFKSSLESLSEDRTHSYVGIFLAWRGQSISGDRFLTYWNRRDAARRVGGASMTEALFKLMFATKPPRALVPDENNRCGAYAARSAAPKDTFILIGHSFGVRILERAISQPLMALLYERSAEAEICRSAYNENHPGVKLGVLTFESPADLIILFNAANDAFEAKAMIDRRNATDEP